MKVRGKYLVCISISLLLICPGLLMAKQKQKKKYAQKYSPTTETEPTFENDRFFIGSQKPEGDETLYYNQSGNMVGRSETQTDNRKFYTGTGKYTGYSRNEFDRTQYYNSSGNFTGYSVQEGTITRHYSPTGEYLGYSQNQDGIILQFDKKDGLEGKSIQLNQ